MMTTESEENTNKNQRLWYKKPADIRNGWDQALPVGNGRIGGMVFGGIAIERIQLNEDSIWYGGPRDRNNPDAFTHLQTIRDLIKNGKIREAERLSAVALSGTPESERTYQTLGDLYLDFDDHTDSDNYERELDLENAITRVNYTIEDTQFTREVFVSQPQQVMVIHMKAAGTKKISFRAKLRRGKFFNKVEVINENTIKMAGNCGGEGSIDYCTTLRALSEDGKIFAIGEHLLIDGANEVTLLLSVVTSFRSEDYVAESLKILDIAQGYSYNGLRQNHIDEYSSLFKRVQLNFRGTYADENLELLPTDERLEIVKVGKDDPGLVSMYFHFGRYLLISCSRPGTLPANLQGIWNKDFQPPWDSKYTININTQMNYWPAEVCNLPECHLPLFDHIERMREPGRRTARVMYNCRGFTAHHNTDIWGDTAPQDIYSCNILAYGRCLAMSAFMGAL